MVPAQVPQDDQALRQRRGAVHGQAVVAAQLLDLEVELPRGEAPLAADRDPPLLSAPSYIRSFCLAFDVL